MHLFEVVALDATDVPPLPVFAGSYDLAVHYYMLWWLHHREGDMPDLEVRKRNRNWPGLNVMMLDRALQLDKPGIGVFDPDLGWRIDYPGDDAAGEPG